MKKRNKMRKRNRKRGEEGEKKRGIARAQKNQ